MSKRLSSSQKANAKKKRVEIDNNQNEQPSSQLSQAAAATRSGKILAIRLKNFMCHKNLIVDFNSRTNLIIGRNGSGKSAILTAIILGLGCRANVTQRSHSIKELVQTGQPRAIIEIHISNDGNDAFEPKKYGNRITVIRQISSAGVSSYKLKNVNDVTVSTARNDLQRLVMYLNIQADNPVCVLTQDSSRGFFRDSDPKKRFELFVKATQLEVITEKLNSCCHDYDIVKTKYEEHKNASEETQMKLKEAEKKFRLMKSMDKMKDEISALKAEQQWLAVMEKEQNLADLQRTLDNANQEKEKFAMKIQNEETEVRLNQERLANIDVETQIERQKATQAREKMNEYLATFNQANDELLAEKRELSGIEMKKKRAVDSIENLEKGLEELLGGEAYIQRDAEINQMKNEVKEMEAMYNGSKRDVVIFKNTEDRNTERINSLRRDIDKTNQDIAYINSQMRNVHNNQSKDDLQIYGQQIPHLLHDIESFYKSGKFSVKPIGPIGTYIKVLQPSYRTVVENVLSSVLGNFLVDNAKDRDVLRDLIKRKYPQMPVPRMITQRFTNKLYDVRPHSVQNDARSIRLMDAFETKDPNVMNCIIEQCKVERILLVNDIEHAAYLTAKKENVPPNLLKVFSCEPFAEYFPAPHYRSYAEQLKMAKFLKVETKDQLNVLKHDLQVQQKQLKEYQTEYEDLSRKNNETQQLLAERKKAMIKWDNDIRDFCTKIADMERKKKAPSEQNVMEQEINAQKHIMAGLEAKAAEHMTKIDELKSRMDKLELKIRETRTEKEKIEAQVAQIQKQKEEIDIEISKERYASTQANRKLQKFDEIIGKMNKDILEETNRLEYLVENAEKLGPRVETVRTIGEIKDMIKSMAQKIKYTTDYGGTVEEAKRNFEQLQKEFKLQENISNELKTTILELKKSTKIRHMNISRLRRDMISRVQWFFKKLMSLRGYDGELRFDSDKSTLDVSVVPRDKNENNKGCGAASLSGGERSYLTVAFLISLWSCIDHPFYFLDEYDVFSDAVNRSYMTKLLLNEAKKHSNSQFTFLTPLDISDVEPSDILSILKLSSPER